MKIKFEVKTTPKSFEPTYTIFMEHKGEEIVEFIITKPNLTQTEIFNKGPTMTKSDVAVTDGMMSMNKANLKKFIAALQLLAKS